MRNNDLLIMGERRLKEIGTEDKCLSPLKNCCFRLLVCQSSAQGWLDA